MTDTYNPFIDSTAWEKFLKEKIQQYYDMENEEMSNI